MLHTEKLQKKGTVVKYIHFILYTITIFSYTIYPMDQVIELVPMSQSVHRHNASYIHSTNNFKHIVKALSLRIYQQYPPTNPLADFFISPQLSEQDMLTIINMPYQEYKKNPSKPLLDALYIKNSSFANAINYFMQFTHKNINSVSCDTLDIVNDPETQQSIEQLNKLPLYIKKYMMKRVCNEVESTYEVALKHSDIVELFCICPVTQLVVTHTLNRQLHLWDLKTGGYITTLPEKDYIYTMHLNDNGTLLATVNHYHKNNMSHIKIWDTQSQKLLSIIKENFFVYHVDFTQETSNNILTVFAQASRTHKKKCLFLWSLNDNAQPIFLGRTSQLQWKDELLTDEDAPYKKIYNTYFYGFDRSILYIAKKNCPELYLCKKAIKNCSYPDTLNNILNTKIYSQLTEYEKQMVSQQIAHKVMLQTKSITL